MTYTAATASSYHSDVFYLTLAVVPLRRHGKVRTARTALDYLRRLQRLLKVCAAANMLRDLGLGRLALEPIVDALYSRVNEAADRLQRGTMHVVIDMGSNMHLCRCIFRASSDGVAWLHNQLRAQ